MCVSSLCLYGLSDITYVYRAFLVQTRQVDGAVVVDEYFNTPLSPLPPMHKSVYKCH